MSDPTPEQEVGIWRQVTGLDVTAVRRLPVDPNHQCGTTIDGVALEPCDRVQLQIGGMWDDERGLERELHSTGVYTVTTSETGWALA